MKRVLTMMLAAAMVLALAACGSSASKAEPEEHPMVGGWSRTDSPVVTEKVQGLLEKAAEAQDGATYIPVAYVATQVVAGTNHALLCRMAPVAPDAVETYAMVYLYEDLTGNVEIMDVRDFGEPTHMTGEMMMGGWSQWDTPEITEGYRNLFDKAAQTITGVSYYPVALLSSQVVAGYNYCYLCEATPSVPNAQTSYALVYVYENLKDAAEITRVVDLPEETV